MLSTELSLNNTSGPTQYSRVISNRPYELQLAKITLFNEIMRSNAQITLQRLPRNFPAGTWNGEVANLSPTCYGLVADLSANFISPRGSRGEVDRPSWHVEMVCRVADKSATSRACRCNVVWHRHDTTRLSPVEQSRRIDAIRHWRHRFASLSICVNTKYLI